jgi:membrane protein implicated in regulation of membrane protease activity
VKPKHHPDREPIDNPWCEAEYQGVGEVSVVGRLGSLIVATRGAAGPGEVLLSVRGSKEAYLAWSAEPLPRGTEVLVIDIRGARTVVVEPWPGFEC